jgi:hypothetical protein
MKRMPQIRMPLKKTELGFLKNELRKYNQEEIISILASLHLVPKNHNNIIRIELATCIACSIKTGNNEKFESKKFEVALNKYLAPFSDIGILEYPLEQLFTENIEFFGGNYIIYPGISDCEPFVLRNLFQSIFFSDEEYPEEFLNLVYGASICILGISHDIAKKLKHARYIVSPENWHEDIEIPDENIIEILRKSVIYSEEELKQLFDPKRVDFRFISPFLNSVGDSIFEETDYQLNPLRSKPLVMCNLKIIVAHPSSLTAALRHFIWITAEKYQCKSTLVQRYQENITESVMDSLNMMGYLLTTIPLPIRNEPLLFGEMVYQIDRDKMAYVIVISDDAEGYNCNNLYSEWDTSEIDKKADERINQVVSYLDGKYCPRENILILKIFSKIGRYFAARLDSYNSLKMMIICADELELISQLSKCDSLTLWKFNEAFKKFDVRNYVEFWSFLDIFSWYITNEYSFNFGDRIEDKSLIIRPGTGRDLRIEASKKFDFHSVEKEKSGKFTTVCKLHLTHNIPIYTPFSIIDRPVVQIIEGYDQPIWIDTNSSEITSTNLPFFANMSDFFSYWIWQMTPGLSPFLKEIGPEPIEIHYEIKNLEYWLDPKHEDFKAIESCNFSVNKRIITIELSSDLIPHFMRSDNHGDRIICSSLLLAFDQMVYEHSHTHSMSDTIIQKILDDFVPLGPKKKISILGSGIRRLLISYYTPPARIVQVHNFSEQNEHVIGELDHDLLARNYSEKSEQTTLCGAIFQVYLVRIRKLIENFSYDSLIRMLIGNYEGLIHHQEKLHFMTTFMVSCYTDINELNRQMSKDIPDLFSVSISTRVLLEIISAEPPIGEKEISVCDMDRLLAMAKHLIQWATISDRIHFDLMKIKNISLDSGVVVLEPENKKTQDNEFMEAKTLESIELAISQYEDQFEIPEKKSLEDIDTSSYDRAYSAEFGISFKEMYQFFSCLNHSQTTFICPVQKSPVLCLPINEFKRRIISKLNWTEYQVDHAIQHFSLIPRERWDLPPPGFSKEDIEPWRNNRKLSYMRKPLIISPIKENESIIYWGPLQIEASFEYLREIVRSGRYSNPRTKEMNDLIEEIVKENSEAFVYAVKRWFEQNTSLFVDSNVTIGPGKKIDSEKDIGDIDVLLIDEHEKKILSIECKNINFGRTSREIDNEITRFLGDKSSKDRWIGKHLKRDEWMRHNYPSILRKYGKYVEEYRIISFFFLSTEILTTFYKDMPLPIFSFSRLEREGKALIDNL